jgi:hypothetical protein
MAVPSKRPRDLAEKQLGVEVVIGTHGPLRRPGDNVSSRRVPRLKISDYLLLIGTRLVDAIRLRGKAARIITRSCPRSD